MKWSLSDVLEQYFAAVRADLGLLLGTVVLVGLLAASWRRAPASLGSRRAQVIMVGCIALGGLLWAWHLRWLSDDAFISFRYARNLVRRDGLVFNLGERVEGYTNFLWVMMLAAAYGVGLNMPAAALFLGLACSVATVLLVYRMSVRAVPQLPRLPWPIPVACALLAANYAWASFSTGGLETMLAALLATLALERALSDRPVAAGLAGIGAAMSHPDHVLFYFALGLALASERKRWPALVRYALPFLFVFLPYHYLRYRYYGSFYPNTYYAKAAYLSYFTQGWFYVGTSALSGGLWGVVPAFVYGLWAFRKELVARYALIAVPIYLTYVAKVGGDYMMGRLLCPILPVLFLVAELGLRRFVQAGRGRVAVVAAALLIPATLATPIIAPRAERWYMTDERTNYEVRSLFPLDLAGGTPARVRVLEENLSAPGIKLSYAAYAIGLVGWLTDWRIVDLHGLTDPVLAHAPLTSRGRPGHERVATPELVMSRGAELSAMPTYPEPYASLTHLTLAGEGFFFVRYRPDVIAHLRKIASARFTDFPSYLDEYLADLRRKRPEDVRRDLAFFTAYYFDTVSDPRRRERIERYARGESLGD